MKQVQAQENLSHLVNVDALLGKLSIPDTGVPIALPDREVPAPPAQNLIPLQIKWPQEVLSNALCDRISSPDSMSSIRSSLKGALKPARPDHVNDRLNRIVKTLSDDVAACRDQLLSLNPGRRKLIEHRLEFIARKVARSRGERWTRSVSLPEVLRDSYRDDSHIQNKLAVLAWKGFAAEVALYHVLELFFLKCLDVYGWRRFEPVDLSRMNFAAHTFLSQRASGFAYDKHCWNFVRTNVYSWYVPTQTALNQLSKLLEGLVFSWSDQDLLPWVKSLPEALPLAHLDFAEEDRTAQLVLDVLERQLGVGLTSNFQGRPVCKKFFLPALEMGGVALSMMDRLLAQVRRFQNSQSSSPGLLSDESLQLHRSIWGCESESFEAFWIEVMALLKIVRTARSYSDWSVTEHYGTPSTLGLNRLPHAMHVVHLLGLELHNLEQLPLSGADLSKLHQGSAGQIQQLEAFDGSVVTDHPDRARSSKWMKAVAEQLPYWRNLVGTSTNLNWGELHLYLALTKLKNNAYCIYLSHRVLPDGGDGDKLRKAILGISKLECFVELHDESVKPYRYLYVFRRTEDKLARDQHRPKFGKLASANETVELSRLEEANSRQAEVAERGWDHLFVRGAAPLIRHLSYKFPKLFQLATIQNCTREESEGLFAGAGTRALEVSLKSASDSGHSLSFTPIGERGNTVARTSPRGDTWFVFPHNSIDLPWLTSLLNSGPVQFWLRHQILAAGNPGSNQASRQLKLNELRSCPVIDLSRTPSEAVHDALDWLGSAKPDVQKLRAWALMQDLPAHELHVRYVALSKRYAALERIVGRYQHLFTTPTLEELKAEAVTQFYPASLLCHVSQSPDLRIQYAGRDRCTLLPENWILDSTHSVVQTVNGMPMAYTIVHTRQGPSVQILMPAAIRDYVNGQLAALREHTWGEALSLLRIPRDIALFAAQTTEIRKVVYDTAQELASLKTILEELALALFEVPAEMRQFLPHS